MTGWLPVELEPKPNMFWLGRQRFSNNSASRSTGTRPGLCTWPMGSSFWDLRSNVEKDSSSGLPGQKSEPRSLDSRVAGNQDSEAYRQRLPWGGDESPGRNGGALSDLGADLRPPLKLDVQFSRIQLSWIGLRSLKRRYQRD